MHLRLLVLYALVLSGCSVIDNQYGFVPNAPPLLPKSYHEVLAHLGAPDTMAVVDNKLALVYHSVEINEPQIGFSIWGVEWLKFNSGDAIAKHNFRFYAFGENGKAIGSVEKKWSNFLGDGGAFGLVFTSVEIADQSRFRARREASLWGVKLLIHPGVAEHSLDEIIEGKRMDIVGQRF